MKIVKLTASNFTKILSQTERVLKDGGIVVCPTDTVYGILGNATDSRVVKKMFEIKKRSLKKGLPVFVKDIPAARKYAYLSDGKAKLLEKIWPGPVTAIFHHKEKLPKILTKRLDTLGLRIPDHKFLLKLLSRIDFPLAETSANISGNPPARNLTEIKKYFAGSEIKPDLLIDGGEIKEEASMVVDFTGKKPVILRTGLVTKPGLDHILSNL